MSNKYNSILKRKVDFFLKTIKLKQYFVLHKNVREEE
jgi:hypothetical protein